MCIRDRLDAGDSDADSDADFGADADTADIPISRRSGPQAQVAVASGERSAGDASVTLQANQAGQAARRVSYPDSLAATPESTGSGVQESVTQSGILIGTPMYMAPELWDSGSHLAQPSSDLFSFGVIAFELLTSVLPFLQPPVFANAQKQPMRIASLRTSRSELDARLCALVDSCLSESPAARPSARVVVQALRELGAPTPM